MENVKRDLKMKFEKLPDGSGKVKTRTKTIPQIKDTLSDEKAGGFVDRYSQMTQEELIGAYIVEVRDLDPFINVGVAGGEKATVATEATEIISQENEEATSGKRVTGASEVGEPQLIANTTNNVKLTGEVVEVISQENHEATGDQVEAAALVEESELLPTEDLTSNEVLVAVDEEVSATEVVPQEKQEVTCDQVETIPLEEESEPIPSSEGEIVSQEEITTIQMDEVQLNSPDKNEINIITGEDVSEKASKIETEAVPLQEKVAPKKELIKPIKTKKMRPPMGHGSRSKKKKKKIR